MLCGRVGFFVRLLQLRGGGATLGNNVGRAPRFACRKFAGQELLKLPESSSRGARGTVLQYGVLRSSVLFF